MATKNNPGAFDCHANAEPDEPMFVLLARDELAPFMVRAWRAARMGNMSEARAAISIASRIGKYKGSFNVAKMTEARKCADDMEAWLKAREP